MDSWFFPFLSFSPPQCSLSKCGSGRDEEPSGENPPPDSDPFSAAQFDRNLARLSRPAYRKRESPLQVSNTVSFSAARFCAPLHDQTHGELVYRPLQFQKCTQHFIGMHDETLSGAVTSTTKMSRQFMSPRSRTAPTPTGFAALLIIQDRLRCGFAEFYLRADFL